MDTQPYNKEDREVNDITMPRFKNWVKPTSVLEALERSLAHARDEEKWSANNWFETGDLVSLDFESGPLDEGYPLRVEDTYVVTSESRAQLTKQIEGMVCTDVKACSAGIVAIETLDGEALYHYLAHGEELESEFLKNDPICWGTIEILAQAFNEEFGPAHESNPLTCVIHHNDYGSINNSRTEHHANIVRGFERAVDIAKGRSDLAGK